MLEQFQINTGAFTAATLIVIWGIVQSFALEYLPWIKDWFDGLEVRKKKTVNAAGILVVVVVAYVLSLADVVNAFTPDAEGLAAAVTAYFVSLGVAQGVHSGTKRS
jgi:hypothetical protein